jgi:hypothetical protein
MPESRTRGKEMQKECKKGKKEERQERRRKPTIKLKIQLLAVDSAFAGALILKGVISAGYNQVIPNHPIENQVLNKNKQSTDTPCAALFPSCSILYNPARTAMVTH